MRKKLFLETLSGRDQSESYWYERMEDWEDLMTTMGDMRPTKLNRHGSSLYKSTKRIFQTLVANNVFGDAQLVRKMYDPELKKPLVTVEMPKNHGGLDLARNNFHVLRHVDPESGDDLAYEFFATSKVDLNPRPVQHPVNNNYNFTQKVGGLWVAVADRNTKDHEMVQAIAELHDTHENLVNFLGLTGIQEPREHYHGFQKVLGRSLAQSREL